VDAPGDFVPPGRTAAQGIAPDERRTETRILRCYSASGAVVPSEAVTCAAAGLSDVAGATVPTAPPSSAAPARRTCVGEDGNNVEIPANEPCAAAGLRAAIDAVVLRCFTAEGAAATTRAVSCSAGGFPGSAGVDAPAAEAAPVRDMHTCRNSRGETIAMLVGLPCEAGYVDLGRPGEPAQPPRHGRHGRHERHERRGHPSARHEITPAGIEPGSIVDERAGEVPPGRVTRRCRDDDGQIVELSQGQDCATAGYTEAGEGPRRDTPSGGYGYGGSTVGPVQVRGYTRANGTYVAPHTRAAPGGGRRR
jgi:hypothetical protein